MSTESRQTILRRFCLTYSIGAGVVYLLLMVIAFPWWKATSHPVMVSIGAPVEAEMFLSFDDSSEPLKLYPTTDNEPYAWHWTTELPPRPTYELSLQFPEGTRGEWLLSGIRLTTVSPKPQHILIDLGSLVVDEGSGVRLRKVVDKTAVSAAPGAQLELPHLFPDKGLLSWFKGWVVATWGYVLVSGVIFLLILTALRFPDGIQGIERPFSVFELVVGGLLLMAGFAIHLHLVGQSLAGYQHGSSSEYLRMAMGLETVATDLRYFPGYPIFLSIALKVSAWELGRVTLLQGILYGISITAVGASLWNLVRGYWIGLIAFLALISPMGVWSSRQISPESLFVSLWMLSLAAFIFVWKSKGSVRLVAWLGFGILVSLCGLTRVSGFVLLILPVFLLTGTFWWCFSLKGRYFYKLPLLWTTLRQISIPVVCVLIAVSSLWFDNSGATSGESHYNLVQTTSVKAPLFSGLVDVRALSEKESVESFLENRFGPGWNVPADIYPDAFRSILGGILPLRATLIGWGRSAGWAMFYPDRQAHDGTPLHQDLTVSLGFQDLEEKQLVLGEISALRSLSGKPLMIELVNYDHSVIAYNDSIVVFYPWIYRVLLFGSMVGWIFCIVEKKYLGAVILAPFLFQMLLFVYWMYVPGRYIHILEAALYFAFMISWASTHPRSLQAATDENDRRSIPPIRPKRLLTRFTAHHTA